MAARRNKRGRRDRGRFGFLYKLLSVVVILAAIVVGCVVFFRVDQIEVEGNAKYSAEEIIAAAEVERGDNLFALDKYRMFRQIQTRLPYVDEVAIYRKLPDTLVISVTERVPAAAVQGDGAWWILDAKTQILERTDFAGAAAYPEVTGITPTAPAVGRKLSVAEGEQFKLDGLGGLLRALAARGAAGQAESFDLTAVNSIQMKYAGRYTVKMPVSTDFDYEVRKIIGTVERLPESESGVIDLTLDADEIHVIPYK